MLIAFGYDISLRLELETAVLFSLKVHPSRWRDLVEGENFRIEPKSRFEEYLDRYGNRCGRVHCQPGVVRFPTGDSYGTAENWTLLLRMRGRWRFQGFPPTS